MKLCYIVYREDNVMVFDSQVLEYLQKIKNNFKIEEVRLILFRHQKNFMKKNEVEMKIKKYVEKFKTFPSLAPPLSIFQLDFDAKKLKKYVENLYSENEKVAVICRGDFSTYIAIKAFKNIQGSRILYDNRGLAVEESLMAHPNNFLHKLNRKIKFKVIQYAKSHCDMYNFVTKAMRNYFIEKYKYSEKLPYTIIPTLSKIDRLDYSRLQEIKKIENYQSDQYIVTYIGSAAAWQSIKSLKEVIQKLEKKYKKIRYFILTNENLPEIEKELFYLKDKITIKKVSHNDMKYYLYLSNIGIVIRNDNIVNKVAAPTKIAEYLSSGVNILYNGDIGILADLKNIITKNKLIFIDKNEEWLDKIGNDIKSNDKTVDESVIRYFDMEYRQNETIEMIKKSFNIEKVR